LHSINYSQHKTFGIGKFAFKLNLNANKLNIHCGAGKKEECVCECVCVWERMSVCVFVCVCEWERVIERETVTSKSLISMIYDAKVVDKKVSEYKTSY